MLNGNLTLKARARPRAFWKAETSIVAGAPSTCTAYFS
jgi:hypothetical protein